MLSDTSRFLAGLTDYAAVVVRDVDDPATVRSVQLVSLAPRVVLLVAVLASGAVEKRTLDMADDVDEVVVGAASAHLAATMTGSQFGRPLLVGASGDPAVDAVVAAAVASLDHGSGSE